MYRVDRVGAVGPSAHRTKIGGWGGAQPGNRFVSFVRAYARSGCLVELDLKFRGSPLSLFPLVPGWSWGFSFLVLVVPGSFPFSLFVPGSFPFSLPPPPKPPIQL